MGAFEALLELHNVLRSIPPALPEAASWAVRTTSLGCKVFTRSEAVTALALMAANSGRDPFQFALLSGRIGWGTPLASQGISDLKIQREGIWKSRTSMEYVKEAGEGANLVFAAHAQRRIRVATRKNVSVIRLALWYECQIAQQKRERCYQNSG